MQSQSQHEFGVLELSDLIDEQASCDIPIGEYGIFNFTVLKAKNSQLEHILLRKESVVSHEPLLVRIHSSCVTGDIFCSQRCDCQQQLHYSLQKIGEEGGMLIYLSQEGRGIGLLNKIKAYQLQDQGYDTLEANVKLGLPVDARNYILAGLILKHYQVNKIRLLTNNPEKIKALELYGIETVRALGMPAFSNAANLFYLQTKIKKFNHMIQLQLN